MSRIKVLENFWPPYLGDGNSNLYSDETGLRLFHKVDAHSSNSQKMNDFHYKGYLLKELIDHSVVDAQH